MSKELLPLAPYDRAVEQAIVILKKGAHLLWYGRRGKPKFCPFRLSMDEKVLIWYSGQEERQLKLSSVKSVIRGQSAKPLQSARDCQSIALILVNDEHSLDLIFKDKAQADSWFLGLGAVVSRNKCPRLLATAENRRRAHSCVNSPAGYIRRERNLGLSEEATKISQVHSLSGSPPQSFSDTCFSDGFSCSSNSFYSELSLSSMQNVMDISTPHSPCIEADDLKKRGSVSAWTKTQSNILSQFVKPAHKSPQYDNYVLRDVLIWGEGIEAGCLGGGLDKISYNNGVQLDALLPKLLDSTTMLDVQKISLGGKHAALVTKQGEVFCWGDGRWGRLGHKIDMDITSPKIVDSLVGLHVNSVACGEYQTCALTLSGELYTWGDNFYGADLVTGDKKRIHCFPHRLSGLLDGVIISNVSCGEWHTAMVSTSGKLFTYGDGTFGVLGHGNLQSFSEPKEVESLKGSWVKSVACGTWHTAAIVEIIIDHFKFNGPGGKLFTWGDGDKGRLGHTDQGRKLLPTCIAQLADHDFIQVSCGRMLTVGLTNVGTVYTMGSAVHGQLGNPLAPNKSITIVQGKLKYEFVRVISCGSFHIAALTSRGNLYTWGKGTNGQLGLGNTEDRGYPTLVEALRDGKIEGIACGSNSTAVICLHKSISCTDQSACKGCSMTFGFIRKKHNCYNCGYSFCHSCSSKKAINASLALNKSSPFRVCEPCFNRLQKTANPCPVLMLENLSSRSLLSGQKGFPDIENPGKDATTTRNQMMSPRNLCGDDSQCLEMKTIKIRGRNKDPLDPNSSFSVGFPRWGQVASPVFFTEKYREQNGKVASMKRESKAGQILSKEVQDLRSQLCTPLILADTLGKLCETRKEKIQECHRNLEETWPPAKEQTPKSKAAKKIIKVLKSRLHVMSEKLTTGKELKDQSGANLPRRSSICADSPTLKKVHPMSVVTQSHPVCGQLELEYRKADSISSSPILLSSKIRTICDREISSGDSRPAEEWCARKTDSEQNGIGSQVEWVEQYQSGVYITFTTLPSGLKGLKRVRFSRKKFKNKEAARWWEENEQEVYHHYGVEGYINAN